MVFSELFLKNQIKMTDQEKAEIDDVALEIFNHEAERDHLRYLCNHILKLLDNDEQETSN